MLALSLAMLYYNHNHPRVSDEQAEVYASYHWRGWVDTALEVIAYEQIRDEERRCRQ
jgi:hypothetical protein